MSPVALTAQSLPAARHRDPPSKILDAAQQFEALLIGQLLQAARQSGTGWLGSGSDAAGSTATEYAEQHLAALLARQGGLGIASLIAKGLASAEAVDNSPPANI